jgi:hypothetical protein
MCERIFSKISIVKNKLKCPMHQYKLDSLILIFTEQELACKLDFNEIINKFKNVIAFKRRLSI